MRSCVAVVRTAAQKLSDSEEYKKARVDSVGSVSEQFRNGTSAQYRLCSAILLTLYKS